MSELTTKINETALKEVTNRRGLIPRGLVSRKRDNSSRVISLSERRHSDVSEKLPNYVTGEYIGTLGYRF